jgi:DNA replication protein DnaC
MRRLEDLLSSALLTANAALPDRIDASSTEPESEADEAAACPYCRGARFVRRRVALGHPEFGRAVPCVCVQEEKEEERSARLQRYSNLGSLSRYTFETLMPRGRSANPSEQERYLRASAAAREFADQPESWLVLTGESGCGKTHIAAAIGNAAIAAGRPCLFMVVPDLLDHLRAAYGPASDLPYDRLFEQVRAAPLLVLDDLGSQSSTAWAEEKLYQIVNHRFQAQLATVFTLSTPIERLEERLRTRLTDPSYARVFMLEAGARESGEMPDLLALPMVRQMTFATFNDKPTGPDLPDQVARRLELAVRIARSYAHAPDGWLVLAGTTGCGKTHLAAAIAHQQRQAGRPYVFVVVPDLLDRLRADIRGERDRPEYIDHVRGCEFLVLDDLGVHSATEWAQEKLYQILNYRYNAKLPTVITVRSTDELPATWVSRMRDEKVGMFHEIQAPDYRDPGRAASPPSRRDRRGR